MMLIDKPDILLLDEPTNHLDIDSIETLEDALNNFEGTLFFISHDRYFINKICDRVVAIENKTFKSYEGNYNVYRKERQKVLELLPAVAPNVSKRNRGKKSGVSTSKTIREPLQLNQPIDQLEKEIQRLEQNLEAVENTMMTMGSNYQELELLSIEKDEIMQQLESLWANVEMVLVNKKPKYKHRTAD